MKATEQMIDAASEASPYLLREHVIKIVQAALDADESLSRMEHLNPSHPASSYTIRPDGSASGHGRSNT